MRRNTPCSVHTRRTTLRRVTVACCCTYSLLGVRLGSWPLLLAACVVRLDDYWPENQSNKESVEPEAYADIRAPVTVSTGTDVDANGVSNPPMASLTTTEDDVIETEDSSMEATAFGSAEAPIWQSAAKQLLAAHPTEVLKVYTRLPASAKLALVNVRAHMPCLRLLARRTDSV